MFKCDLKNPVHTVWDYMCNETDGVFAINLLCDVRRSTESMGVLICKEEPNRVN